MAITVSPYLVLRFTRSLVFDLAASHYAQKWGRRTTSQRRLAAITNVTFAFRTYSTKVLTRRKSVAKKRGFVNQKFRFVNLDQSLCGNDPGCAGVQSARKNVELELNRRHLDGTAIGL